MTLRSLLWFVVVWLKYDVVPEPLRYAWWLVWSRLRAAAHAIHRRSVIQGAPRPGSGSRVCSKGRDWGWGMGAGPGLELSQGRVQGLG